jgi:hypothetical protein
MAVLYGFRSIGSQPEAVGSYRRISHQAIENIRLKRFLSTGFGPEISHVEAAEKAAA